MWKTYARKAKTMVDILRKYSTRTKPAFCGAVKKYMPSSKIFLYISTYHETAATHQESFLEA